MSFEIHEKIIFPANPSLPRRGEGDLIVLKDDRLFLAFTEFYGGSSDFSPARIMASISSDKGRSWGTPYVLQENIGKCNVMSVSLLRLKSGEIAFFYGVKNSFEDLRFYMRKSFDEGVTWSDPILVTRDKGYMVVNNDRVVQLTSGRIVAPVATYQDPDTHSYWKSFVYYSDDGGESWRRSKGEVKLSPSVDSPTGLQEPGIVELRDGRLMMYMRTALGHIYLSYSEDEGETWCKPLPLHGVKAPTSPVAIKRIPDTGDLMLVWNDKSEFDLEDLERRGADIVDRDFQHRAPLSCAISSNEGETWKKVCDIETDRNYSYSYPSITFYKDKVILTYYVAERLPGGPMLIHLKLKIIPVNYLYRGLQ